MFCAFVYFLPYVVARPHFDILAILVAAQERRRCASRRHAEEDGATRHLWTDEVRSDHRTTDEHSLSREKD